MVDPGEIGAYFSEVFNFDLVSQLLTYVGYFVFAIFIFAFFAAVYYITIYKFKVTYPILHYDTADKKSAQIIGYKKDRARTIKTRDGVKKQKLFFKRQLLEPFKEVDVHPGNKVNLMKINEDGTYLAMPNLKFTNPVAEFEQLTPEERYWAVLQLNENSKTYQNEDAQRRIMLMTLGTVVLCFIMVGIAIWLIMKSPADVVSSFDSFGQQFLATAQSIGGIPPG